MAEQKTTSTEVVALARDQLVIDRESYYFAGEILNTLANLAEDVEDRFGEQVKSAWNTHKVAKAQLDRHLKPIKDAQSLLRGRMQAYHKRDPKAESPAQVSEYWDFTIDDESKIPREFLLVDSKKIRERVRSLKGLVDIPGVIPVRRSLVKQAAKNKRHVTVAIDESG